ncbi:hypothetical protein GGR77_002245 [Xanthomonas translucens]
MDILVLDKRARTVAAARHDGNGKSQACGFFAQRRAHRLRGAVGDRRCDRGPAAVARARRGEDAVAPLNW